MRTTNLKSLVRWVRKMQEDTLERILNILLVLLVLGYIGINFIAPLPPFLIGENITYAVLYGLILYLSYKNGYKNTHLLALTTILGFNIGRVSRSIISPRGEIEYLALEHIPLISFLILVLVFTLVTFYNRLK